MYTALDCAAVAAIHPFYTASVREFERAGRPIVPSAPVGVDGTAAWLEGIGAACGIDAARIGAAKDAALKPIGAVLAAAPIDARLIVSGYEGSELLVARLAIESGATVHYVGTRLPEDALVGAGPRVARGARRGTSSSAPPSSRISRRSTSSSPDLAIRDDPRSCRRPRDARGAGAVLHEPDLGAPD